MIDRIIEELGRYDRFLLSSHDSPDGDAIGSELGLRALLLSMGKQVTIVNPSPIPDNLLFLPGVDQVHAHPLEMNLEFDAFVGLDAGRRDRLHPVEESAPDGTPFFNIDHHEGNDDFGTFNWCDPRYGSTGEMIYDLVRASGIHLGEEIAVPLYVALLTDTGRFSFANTTPSGHRMAEVLLESGVSPAEIHRHVYRDKPIERLRLEARAIERLQTALDGRIAWCAMDLEALAAAGCTGGEARDLIDIPASLRGVEIAMVLRELPDGGGTRVSLRSSEEFRVNRFAARYGGGGHPKAAGLRLPCPLREAENRIVEDLIEALAGETAAEPTTGRE